MSNSAYQIARTIGTEAQKNLWMDFFSERVKITENHPKKINYGEFNKRIASRKTVSQSFLESALQRNNKNLYTYMKEFNVLA